MRILLCHNRYQHAGGEDRVFEDEGALLEKYGHQVFRFTISNDSIVDLNRIELVAKTFWNKAVASELDQIICRDRPDVMHVTNAFPLISPSAYKVAKDHGVGVVQSIHNYRMLCPKAQFVRNSQVCEKCLGKRFAWPAIYHACYKENRLATTVVAAMTAFHRARNSWTQLVDRFIAPTQFVKDKHIEGGFDARQIDVKPNFVFPDPGSGSGDGNYVAFAGRLSAEKGVDTLLETWQHLSANVRLKIAGDGPLADRVKAAADADNRIEWLGRIEKKEMFDLLGQATCLIMPSVCYETFGLTIVEAFSKGTPVVVSRMGAMQELVQDGRNGFLVEPGNAKQFAATVDQVFSMDTAELRVAARQDFELKYTAEANQEWLTDIYSKALSQQVQSPLAPPVPLGSSMERQTN
ncbi:MAG: glycosyltransferase family 4 protein [Planctomycetaceae bacterium]|nr:glycosyltransferase family 4 protein [Planctomycetaceae bacterium]